MAFSTPATLSADIYTVELSKNAEIRIEIPETILDTFQRICRQFNPITCEIGGNIIEAESSFRNICNAEGCRYGIGVFQFTQTTFNEQCQGDIMNVEDNIKCGLRLIQKGEYWRWEQSMNKWLPLLSAEIRYDIQMRCNCVVYARAKIWGTDIPIGTDAKDIEPNSTPKRGGAVILDYNGVRHIAIIEKLKSDYMEVSETNFKRCRKTWRRIYYDDPHIVGFYY